MEKDLESQCAAARSVLGSTQPSSCVLSLVAHLTSTQESEGVVFLRVLMLPIQFNKPSLISIGQEAAPY